MSSRFSRCLTPARPPALGVEEADLAETAVEEALSQIAGLNPSQLNLYETPFT